MLIDAHTHAFAPAQLAARDDLCARDATFAQMYGDPKARMVDCSSIAATMERAGFDAAVVAGFAFSAQRDIDEQNAHLLEGSAEHPGVVIPVATVNPALPGWERAAAKAIEDGARGLGELRPHNQGWDPSGPEGSPAGGLCAGA
ncbi:MAG: hypothetical protein U5Q44_16845 [Dehalococcoidia bacterium]|nr:hypothetical protein [Dehalococcoidia bacterium]